MPRSPRIARSEMSLRVSVAGRFAREALAAGEGEVCALFRRSFYLRFPGERYACVGDASLGRGPLNALVPGLILPAMGERFPASIEKATLWAPHPLAFSGAVNLKRLQQAAAARVPE